MDYAPPADQIEKRRKILRRRIYVTRGCSHGAAARLEKRDFQVNLAIAVLAVLLACITVAPKYLNKSEEFIAALSVASLIVSLLLVVAALAHFANRDSARAYIFHRCALELDALILQMDFEEMDLSLLSKIYTNILVRYPNHDPQDFFRYKMNNPDLFHPKIYENHSRLAALRYMICVYIGKLVCYLMDKFLYMLLLALFFATIYMLVFVH